MGGVAVVGTNTWSVLEGRRKLGIEWDDGPNVAHDSGTYDDRLRAAARTGGHVIRDRGNVDEAFATADKVLAEADVMIRVGWYRSVNNIQHAFAMNCFANELAEAAGRDPVEYLLALIGDADVMDLKDDGVLEHWNYGDSTEDWPIMPRRLSNVLRVVAAKSGYGKALPEGHGLGLAVHRSFHSYVATAVHVVVHDDGTFRIPQVDTAIDCGRYVNPEGVRKQIEGAAIYGNTVAQFGKITTSKGAVVQSNFHDYPITRMNNAPLDVRVHIVEDFVHLRPCGVGEPGVPPYAPALVNAIHDATGKRIRSLPIGDQLKSA